MLVPGVSGGSMAMILGIYDKLISSVGSFMRHKRASAFFLGFFCLGAVLGMILFAKPIQNLIEWQPMPTMYFFIGAVTGGIPLIFRQAKISTFSLKIPLCLLIGAAAVVAISWIPSGSDHIQNQNGAFSIISLVATGILSSVALVLPGISISYLLLLLGLYDDAMYAISNLHLPFLIPIGIGFLIGILVTTKLLEKALTRYPQTTHLIILGFILGSVVNIFPGIPSGGQLFICPLTFAAGFLAIFLLSRKEAGSSF